MGHENGEMIDATSHSMEMGKFNEFITLENVPIS